MERISFQIAEVQAPLDLILQLISKHKLNILDIDISSLLEQYLNTIAHWKETDLDVSSEFLEMASRLVYIKTVSLLPQHEEETQQLKRYFEEQLMEYRLCKIASELLREQERFGDSFVRPMSDVQLDPSYRQSHPPSVLYSALIDAMGKEVRRRPLSEDEFDALVTRPIVSVSAKIITVLRLLRKDYIVSIEEVFSSANGRSDLVATFLAILELMKAGTIWLEEDRLSIRQPSSAS